MTVASQRMGMLTGIGNLSQNTVSGANTLQNLGGTVAELFIPVLQQEGNQRAILFSTRMHSSRMHTIRCSGHLLGG